MNDKYCMCMYVYVINIKLIFTQAMNPIYTPLLNPIFAVDNAFQFVASYSYMPRPNIIIIYLANLHTIAL